jgi:hypothetical protein
MNLWHCLSCIAACDSPFLHITVLVAPIEHVLSYATSERIFKPSNLLAMRSVLHKRKQQLTSELWHPTEDKARQKASCELREAQL